jgi:hypothetical protein
MRHKRKNTARDWVGGIGAWSDFGVARGTIICVIRHLAKSATGEASVGKNRSRSILLIRRDVRDAGIPQRGSYCKRRDHLGDSPPAVERRAKRHEVRRVYRCESRDTHSTNRDALSWMCLFHRVKPRTPHIPLPHFRVEHLQRRALQAARHCGVSAPAVERRATHQDFRRTYICE